MFSYTAPKERITNEKLTETKTVSEEKTLRFQAEIWSLLTSPLIVEAKSLLAIRPHLHTRYLQLLQRIVNSLVPKQYRPQKIKTGDKQQRSCLGPRMLILHKKIAIVQFSLRKMYIWRTSTALWVHLTKQKPIFLPLMNISMSERKKHPTATTWASNLSLPPSCFLSSWTSFNLMLLLFGKKLNQELNKDWRRKDSKNWLRLVNFFGMYVCHALRKNSSTRKEFFSAFEIFNHRSKFFESNSFLAMLNK